jgi:hypothetical protein
MTAHSPIRVLVHHSKNVAPLRDRIERSAIYTAQCVERRSERSTNDW